VAFYASSKACSPYFERSYVIAVSNSSLADGRRWIKVAPAAKIWTVSVDFLSKVERPKIWGLVEILCSVKGCLSVSTCKFPGLGSQHQVGLGLCTPEGDLGR
jgi:hypothetical protein